MLSQIAQAVASDIAALPDVPPGGCEFRHLHEWDGMNLTSLKVAVTPRGMDASNASRGTLLGDYRVGIVVAKRATTEEEASEVMSVAEAILMRLKTSPVLEIPNSVGRVAFSSANLDLTADDSLNEYNVYRAAIEATYKVLP